MRLAKTMNAEQFAKVLWELEADETVEFGLDRDFYSGTSEDDPLETYDVNDWFFAKRIEIPKFDSEFILVDWVGGGQAYAIPLCDQWDEIDMVSDTETLFKHLETMNGYEIKEVYVDMGEQEE